MSEIKTTNKEKLAQWIKDENLDVLNNIQLCAKIMELEERIEKLENPSIFEQSL